MRGKAELPAVWGCSPIQEVQWGRIHHHIPAPQTIWPCLWLLLVDFCLSVRRYCRQWATDKEQNVFDPWRENYETPLPASTHSPKYETLETRNPPLFVGKWCLIHSKYLEVYMRKDLIFISNSLARFHSILINLFQKRRPWVFFLLFMNFVHSFVSPLCIGYCVQGHVLLQLLFTRWFSKV